MRIHTALAGLLAGILALSACKKDDADTTLLYFHIYPGLDHPLPKFVKPGDIFTFNIYGAQRDTNDTSKETIGYYFSCTNGKNDTVRVEGGTDIRPYTVTIPDTLGTFYVNGFSFAKGYYSGTVSTSANIVKTGLDGNGSLTGFYIAKEEKAFTDSRDGRQYYVTTIGDVQWMRNNLSYSGYGLSYSNCECMDEIFGRYYSWEDAKKSCPDGWGLPSNADFNDALSHFDNVGAFLADISFNGQKMWEYLPAVRITDESRLSMIPTGYGVFGTVGTTFYDLNARAVFWTSDASEAGGLARNIYKDRNVLYESGHSATDFYATVRCVKHN